MPDHPRQSDDSPQRIHQSIFDRVKALFIRTGNITQTVVQGIPAELFQRLAEELGVTKAALTSFFKILEQQNVPFEDLGAKLCEIGTHYKALLERIHTLSADDPDIAQLHNAAEAAIHEWHFDRAEQLLNEASARDLAAARELQDLMTKRLLAAAEGKATNGALKMTQLAYVDAANYYRQATEIVEQLPAGSEVHLARFLNDWGLASYYAGDYRDAEHPWQRALAIREAVLGAQHPDVATSLNNLALLYQVQGRYAEAEPLYQRALAIYEQGLGAQHPDIAASLNNLAELYQAQGHYTEAEPLLQRALAIREQGLGAQHPDVAQSLNNLAELYRVQGCYAEAEPLYQRALAIYEQGLGAQHPDVATSLNNLAELYANQGQFERAVPLLEQAVQILRQLLGEEHPSTQILHQHLERVKAAMR